MKKMNSKQYTNVNNAIKDYVHSLMQNMVSLPIIIGETQSMMIERYDIDPNDLNMFKSYVCKKVYEIYLQNIVCHSETHIDWNELHGVKTDIWKFIVKFYYEMISFEETIVKTGKALLKKYDIQPKYLLWIGMYISEAADIVFFSDNDCGMEDSLYMELDNNEYTYQGLDLTTNIRVTSPCEQGVVNEKNEIIAPFDPNTVEVFMDMYDDMIWDLMTDEMKEKLLEIYHVPEHMVRIFSETWRGMPIFTHDIIITTVYDKNNKCKGDVLLTHILMGEDIITLILQNDNDIIIQEDDVQFSMNIGSLHDHPEFTEMYETALSTAIMKDPET